MIESVKKRKIPLLAPEDNGKTQLDPPLRPQNLIEYVGQKKIKDNLHILLSSAKQRNESLEHILLYGAPGLGKTTLAGIIAKEMGVNIRATSGPAIEKPGDLAALLTNLQNYEILFIDEIHRLKTTVEELLYGAMEDYHLDIIIGKGPAAKAMRLSLPKFTLIGATTKISMLSSPLRDRFGSIFHLKFYSNEQIQNIILRSAGIINLKIDDAATNLLARCSRQTPRIANRLLRRVRDFALINNFPVATLEVVKKTLNALGIDEDIGLDESDRQLLKVLIEKFSGGPVGLGTLAAATSEEKETIEDVYEPFLIKIGFLERTPKGRKATLQAWKYLNISPSIPSSLSQTFIK